MFSQWPYIVYMSCSPLRGNVSRISLRKVSLTCRITWLIGTVDHTDIQQYIAITIQTMYLFIAWMSYMYTVSVIYLSSARV